MSPSDQALTAHAQGSAPRLPYLVLPYLFAAWIAYVLLKYLPFKFASDSHLFQVLEDWAGMAWAEPHFRYLTGGVEALICVLLFIPGLQVAGAALAFATMGSAILLHLFTPPGVDPYNDRGRLFLQACATLVAAAAILIMRRDEILPLLRFLVVDRRFGGRGG